MTIDFQQLAFGAHLLGFAVGLGGATVSDVMFLKAVRKRMLSAEHYGFLQTLSRIIWTGYVLLVVSGITMFTLIYAEQESIPMLSSPRWQAKLALVAIVGLNGMFFKLHIFPVLNALVGKTLSLSNLGRAIWKLAFSGTVSILSWYSIFAVTLLPRTFRPHIVYFALTYMLFLCIGMFTSRMAIKTLLGK